MRCCFFYLLLIVSCTTFSQVNFEYFPQETILIGECEGVVDPHQCLYQNIESKIQASLINSQNKRVFRKVDKDTLKILGVVFISKKNQVDKTRSHVLFNENKYDKAFKSILEPFFRNLEITKVDYKKPSSAGAFHTFRFNYIIERRGKELSLDLIENEKKYSGADVEEAPKFPWITTNNPDQARIQFQEEILRHVNYHFRYPERPLRLGISGKVETNWIIDENGDIKHLNAEGPHKDLEAEAKRIINLLPKMIPGRINGKPVSVPMSLPIAFRLP